MDYVKEYIDLKRKIETTQQSIDKAKGALEQLLKNLKQDFNCETVEEAEEKLKTLQEEQLKLEEQFNEELKNFKKKWNEI